MEPDDTVDTLGLKCPLPVLRARKRLAGMENGALLLMQADDLAALIDVPHFCAEAGHALVDQSQDGEVLSFLIRKGG